MEGPALLDWLAQHQATLTWLAGGAASAAGGLWIAAKYFLDRGARRPAPDGARGPSGGPARPLATASGGMAAGRDLRAGRDVVLNQNRVPPAAVGLAALGLLLLGYAASGGGTRIAAQNSAVNTGTMTDSRQSVTTSGPAGGPDR